MRTITHRSSVRRVALAVLAGAAVGTLVLLDPQSAAAAGSLTSVAQRASSEMKTIAGSLVTIILAVSAVVLLIKKDFAAAAGVLVLGLLAASFTTGAGWSVLQSTAKAVGL